VQPSSDEFGTLVKSSHQYALRVVVTSQGISLEDTYSAGTHLRVLDGSVTIDRTSDTRRTCDLTLLDMDGTGKVLVDPIAGAELEVYRGIILDSTGQPEWIQLGKFTSQDMSVGRDGAAVTLRLSMTDRSDRIRQNPLRTIYQVASGTNQMAALSAFYTNRASGFTPVSSLMVTTKTSPDTFYSESDDPWQIIQDMATAASGEVYHDPQGVLQCWPIAEPDTVPPAYNFSRDAVLITPITRNVSRRDVYNGVIVRGEAPWLIFPISGEVWDDNPASPTWRGGPFGEKPKIIGSAVASTNAECATIAASEFAKIKGVSEKIDFGMMTDPRLDVIDVIQIIDTDLGVSGRYSIETLTLPLLDGSMSGTIKRRR